MTDRKGIFIVLEGIDGAGTTTQARRLVRRFSEMGQEAIYTQEPTSGPIGNMIRQVLGGRLVAPGPDGPQPLNADSMSLLFSADRLDHLQTLILPALERGAAVICDRYYYSTIAYQGVEGDIDWIRELNKKALQPDVVLYLQLSAEQALKRIQGRTQKEIYEKRDFLEKVVANYDALFKQDSKAFVLDGSLSMDLISEQILSIVRS